MLNLGCTVAIFCTDITFLALDDIAKTLINLSAKYKLLFKLPKYEIPSFVHTLPIFAGNTTFSEFTDFKWYLTSIFILCRNIYVW